jgi:dihydrolipoamide dehydrogenase
MKKAEVYGLSVQSVGFDFPKVMERSRGVANQMARGIEFLFKKNKVEYCVGRAQAVAAGMVEIVDGELKGRFFKAQNILIATGCRMRRLPGLAVDGVRVMTSREALAARTLPKSVAVVGAGAIGVEFAYFFNAFGSRVTLIEMLPQILPLEDEEVSLALRRSFEKQGIAVHTGTTCEHISVEKDSVKMDLVKDGVKQEFSAEALLVAVGVEPNLEGALFPGLKLDLERGYVKVGDDYQTSAKGIYAAGDIIGPPWLAHVATFEAVNAVNGMFGAAPPRRVRNFPGCTYCQPQVASTGLTEKAAREKGLPVKIGKFPFSASGKAVASAETEGFVKIVSQERTGEILGVHILGAEATELIAEFGLAIELEATVEDLHRTIHAHPTLSEAAMEAAAAVHGEAIHL